MPKLTRWLVKASLVYFNLALVAGLLVAARVPLSLPDEINSLSPVYFHLLMVGWVAQLIFGIVFWMFPKYSSEKPRAIELLGWVTFWLINSGLALRLIREPLQTISQQAGFGWLLSLSALLQWLAGMVFVLNTWPRVKGRKAASLFGLIRAGRIALPCSGFYPRRVAALPQGHPATPPVVDTASRSH